MKRLLIFILNVIIFVSCTKVDESKAVDESIKLSSYSVHFLAGDQCLIDIHTEKRDLAIYDENPDIATGWWENDNKSILVIGEGVGCTSIIIKDRTDHNNYVEIKVTSDYFGGKYKEIGGKSRIIVQAVDQFIESAIISDFKSIVSERSGTIYTFNKSDKTVEIDKSKVNRQADSLTGKYDWDKNSLALIIDDKKTEYGFCSLDKCSVLITLDLTEMYRAKYPATYISMAKIAFFLTSDLNTGLELKEESGQPHTIRF